MYKRRKHAKISAFTLTELLIALAILGAIAAMSIPSVINNLQRKILSTTLKNFTTEIQQLITNEMIANKTKNLSDTDFAEPTKLLTSNNFEISKNCTGTGCIDYSLKTLNNTLSTLSIVDNGVMLKNGIVFLYRIENGTNVVDADDPILGRILVDVNGSEKPNIIGRDFFAMYVTQSGKITNSNNNLESSTSNLATGCKNGTSSDCFIYLLKNSWNMDY
jgi:prepilin-type N-terminal cleavage/methylation domain-containing protein